MLAHARMKNSSVESQVLLLNSVATSKFLQSCGLSRLLMCRDVSVCGRLALVGWEAGEIVARKAEVAFELQRVFGRFGAKWQLQARVIARPRSSLEKRTVW